MFVWDSGMFQPWSAPWWIKYEWVNIDACDVWVKQISNLIIASLLSSRRCCSPVGWRSFLWTMMCTWAETLMQTPSDRFICTGSCDLRVELWLYFLSVCRGRCTHLYPPRLEANFLVVHEPGGGHEYSWDFGDWLSRYVAWPNYCTKTDKDVCFNVTWQWLTNHSLPMKRPRGSFSNDHQATLQELCFIKLTRVAASFYFHVCLFFFISVLFSV